MTYRPALSKSELRALAQAATCPVTRVAVGARTIDESAWRRMCGKAKPDPIDERHIVIDHCGREHVRNGLGEWLS